MKTSNKILLGIISIIGLSMLSVLIFAKSSLINVENNSVTGDGKIIKVNYNIGEISFFKLRGKYEVYVKKGMPQLVIETDENIQAFLDPDDNNISYYNHGDGNEKQELKRTLRIGQMDNVSLLPTESIKIYLSTPDIEGINISDLCKVTFEDVFNSKKFSAEIRDFAEANLKITTEELNIETKDQGKVNISGTIGTTEISSTDFSEVSITGINAQNVTIDSKDETEITLTGSSQMLNIKTNGLAKIDTKSLAAQSVDVQANDQSETSLAASQKLDINASDQAKIKYSGTPEITKSLSDQANLSPVE